MMQTRRFLIDGLAWGAALWLFGYVLGMILFFVVPVEAIGFVIMPMATLVTLWVASREIEGDAFGHYLAVGLAWLIIAVAGDYVFIVKLLHPADGYYKPDVLFYYALTLAIPVAAGFWRLSRRR